MPEAITNRTNLYFAEETVFNETPATPQLIELPFTGESLKHNKATDTSAEIDPNRNIEDLVEIGVDTNGQINFELQHSAYDKFFESAFCSTFLADTVAAVTCAIATAGQTITRNTGTFSAQQQGAKYVKVAGAATPANNGIKRVVSWSDTVITCAAGSFTAIEATPSLTLTTKYIRNGVSPKSFLIEKKFGDIAQFIHYRGQIVNAFALEVTAKQKINGNFAFIGAKGVTPSGTTIGNGSPTAKTTDPIFRAGANVGALLADGTAISSGIRALNLAVGNNFRGRDVINSKEWASLGMGDFDVTGAINAYFVDAALLAKYYAHTALALHTGFVDDLSQLIAFTYPKIYFTEGDPEISAKNEDVMLNLPFRAVYGGASNPFTLQMDYLK
jgi:hypothetical protein